MLSVEVLLTKSNCEMQSHMKKCVVFQFVCSSTYVNWSPIKLVPSIKWSPIQNNFKKCKSGPSPQFLFHFVSSSAPFCFIQFAHHSTGPPIQDNFTMLTILRLSTIFIHPPLHKQCSFHFFIGFVLCCFGQNKTNKQTILYFTSF